MWRFSLGVSTFSTIPVKVASRVSIVTISTGELDTGKRYKLAAVSLPCSSILGDVIDTEDTSASVFTSKFRNTAFSGMKMERN